ncbi:predicted protein [Phaeodactylum tricornutum CCAP 1055/1]|uniref:EGF-like domain-containing protein n=1 Tax=Phaeodactylum tricornutum (strain CCAP 1055/1) TaxID=556484 RepID=B7G525_PHATC|nr:predicted protein [Phaeodactylum tricornutum CCAP 1055/1]EEC46243.1 predicted protein [Phaeodactylum tricornutum CCAP 1055/1]|eukprot:XP_002182342.1 predicted protein [Phaeodactylum tricornutum CCAP 1055/1]
MTRGKTYGCGDRVMHIRLGLFLLLSLMFQYATAQQECSPACGPYGRCSNVVRTCTGRDCEKACRCKAGFAGADCSIPFTLCEDTVNPAGTATVCYNGGSCLEAGHYDGVTKEDVWWCDCSTAYTSTGTAFAGHQCEFPHGVSCETGLTESSYAFCVNGGSCLETIAPGSPHPGCRCVGQFEGRHCQYAAGTAPEKELTYTDATRAFTDGDDGISAGVVFILVALVLAVVAGAIFLVLRRGRRNASNKEMDTNNAPQLDDLQLTSFVEHKPEQVGMESMDAIPLEDVDVDGSERTEII